MNTIIFYKLKKVGNDWYVIFLDKDNNYKIIHNDRSSLVSYLNSNKNCIFIGANNFKLDDILLTSILKDGTLNAPVDENDKIKYLCRTLDITQGIVRNNLVDFNTILCSMWNKDKPMINFYALNQNEIEKELIFDIEVIKALYNLEERKNFINWKLELIEKYNLPKNAYWSSFGKLMEYIIGMDIPTEEKFSKGKRFTLDSKLFIELNNKNDNFLNNTLNMLQAFYRNNDENKSLSKMIGDCLVKFNQQGILGSKQEDHIDVDGENTYLYIDFNSFGPNILINNNWLNDVAKYPERYNEIKKLRIDLKSKKDQQQMFYKYILNAGLDDLSKVYTKEGYNVGLSLSVTGIMIMLLLYKNIEQYGVELIECNTDGLIVKCPKINIERIKGEVKKIEETLSLSCDVDVVKKIAHFDEKNYVMEFENGKVKNLGVFGLFQDNPLNSTGIQAVDEAIRNYYLYDIPVGITLRKFRDEKNLKAFQIIKKQRSNEKEKYIKINNEYVLSTSLVNRLFAVKKDNLKNPFYVINGKGKYEVYKTKKGKKVKDGYAYFEVADRDIPSIDDIDLTYYIDKCYKVIDNHPKKVNLGVNVNLNKPYGYAFFDLDGTLIEDKSDEVAKKIFEEAIGDKSQNPEKDFYLFSQKPGSYLIQFLSLCKKYKGYGTIDNFAEFLKENNFLLNVKNIDEYKRFVERYLELDKEYSTYLKTFDNSKEVLEKLKNDGYRLYLYSNWFKNVQEAKLDANDLLYYFDELCTIDDYYAKSSVKGWQDVLESNDIDSKDLTIMVGNGSSDIVPKTIRIPSIIINHKRTTPPQKVTKSGIILYSFDEMMNPNFNRDISHIKRKIK